MKKLFAFSKTLNAKAKEISTKMFGWRRYIPVVLICLMVFLGLVRNAAAHRRGGLPLGRPAPLPATQTTNPQAEKAFDPLVLKPDLYWQRLLALEKTGEFEEAFKSGMALVNLFPQAPQRGAALLKLAELAKGKGETARALELYDLTIFLVPGTPEAAQACLGAHVLELSQDLSNGDPLLALRHFLTKVTALPSGYAPETLQEALRNGWQVVFQKVRIATPPPLTLVEDILALWDLQPQGIGPPEVACLLADLLRENGLFEEAQNLLAQESKRTREERRSKLQTNNLELAWLSKGFPGIADFLQKLPDGEEKQRFLLRHWLTREQPKVESFALPVEALMTWFMPQKANACWDGQLPSLEQNLKHPWAAPVEEQLQASLAKSYWTKGHFSPAAQIYAQMADKPQRADLSPFYQDRLGLSRLKGGETDAAQKTYQELAQHNDPFWQRLAQVRLTDLELSRVQADPSP